MDRRSLILNSVITDYLRVKDIETVPDLGPSYNGLPEGLERIEGP